MKGILSRNSLDALDWKRLTAFEAVARHCNFTRAARDSFAEAAARCLTGEEAFVAKLHPEFAPFAEYDQLMRRDEWYGRER